VHGGGVALNSASLLANDMSGQKSSGGRGSPEPSQTTQNEQSKADADKQDPGKGAKSGIYEFPDQTAGGKPYVGQSSNLPSRLSQHENAGRLEPGTEATKEVAGGKTQREIAEHQRIQEITGGAPARQSDSVANRVDPIGPKRRVLLPPK
jgi:hypothetical protein